MSKLFDYRTALKTAIVDGDIGWTDDTVLLKRQTDLWNDVASAIQSSKNGAVLHIGVASGKRADDDELNMELSLPLTILCLPQVEEGATPEEDLWEDLVKLVEGMGGSYEPRGWRYKFESFTDLEVDADGEAFYLARQTIFTRTLNLS